MEGMKQCPMCRCWAFADTFSNCGSTELGDIEICPRCVFVVGLYYERGIKKDYVLGCLQEHFLPNAFKKILREFNENPVATYEKYLPNLLRENRRGQVTVTRLSKELTRLKSDFPFLLEEPEEVKEKGWKEGTELEFRNKAGKLAFKRKICAMAIQSNGKMAVFVPPPEWG